MREYPSEKTKVTRIILRSSFATGIAFGLVFLATHFIEVKTKHKLHPSIIPNQSPVSKAFGDLPFGDNAGISVSSNSLAADERYSPRYLMQENRTIWHAESPPKYPQWVEISFSKPMLITHLGIRSQGDSLNGREHGRGPKDFTFQGSNEISTSLESFKNQKWTDLLKVKNNIYTRGEEWKDWFFRNNTEYRHYRIFIKAGGDPDYLTIRQIRLDNVSKISESRVEMPPISVEPAALTPKKVIGPLPAKPIVISRSIPRAFLNPPNFNAAGLREWYNDILKEAGIKTKEEAMEFSLAFWEKRRKIYFS